MNEPSPGHAHQAAHRVHQLAVLDLEKAAEVAFGHECLACVVEGGATDGAGHAPLLRFPDEGEDSREQRDPIRVPTRESFDQPQRLRLLHHRESE